MSRQPPGDNTPSRDVVLPHPAEDLSADDDLLSWVLVDQLGSMPNTKLGVHPQQVKFVGPAFKTDEVLNIVRETVTKGNIQAAMQRLQEFHLFRQHLDTKITAGQKERFIKHLRRYLLVLQPASRLEIHLTSRYTFITGHTELAVFATRPLIPGTVMQELQGSVVPLPNEWREEMDIGDDYAVEAAGEESDSEDENAMEEEDDGRDTESAAEGSSRRRRAREERKQQGQRRSDRTKRRDFSIVWSGLKRCYQLFLGPARFLNHDCNPNVELLRQGNYVTFRVTKPIKIGDELTTFYGENYSSIDSLCLTCEQQEKGGFAPKPPPTSRASSRRGTRGLSTTSDSQYRSRRGSTRDSTFAREPSSLRNEVTVKAEPMSDNEEEEEIDFGPSMTLLAQSGSGTGTEEGSLSAVAEVSNAVTPFEEGEDWGNAKRESSVATEDEENEPPRRERYARKATQALKPWLQPKHKGKYVEQEVQYVGNDEDVPCDFPRCATCAKPLTDQIWYNGRYFDHCQRCVRHALVFDLPWPAHRSQDIQEYPPAHLVPPGYIPRKISTVPLPSLSKAPRIKPVKFIVTEEQDGYHDGFYDRRARRLRDEIDAETFVIESLREAAWSAQEAREAAQEAKEEEKKRRLEEKRKLDATRVKGSGVWSRYEYVDEQAIRKKEEERWKVQPGLTRRGTVRNVPQPDKDDEGEDQRQPITVKQEVQSEDEDSGTKTESEEDRNRRAANKAAGLAKRRETMRLAKEKKQAQDEARRIRAAEQKQKRAEKLREEREEKEKRKTEGASSGEEEEEDRQVFKRVTRSGGKHNPIVIDGEDNIQPAVRRSPRTVEKRPRAWGTQGAPIVIDDDDLEDEIRVAAVAGHGRAQMARKSGPSSKPARSQSGAGAGPQQSRASTSAQRSRSTPKQTPRSGSTGVRSSGRKTKPTPKMLEQPVSGSRSRRTTADVATDAFSGSPQSRTPRLVLKIAAARSVQLNGAAVNGASSPGPSSTAARPTATPIASSSNTSIQSESLRKRGRPPGTGKWQIAAAAALARSAKDKAANTPEQGDGPGPSIVNDMERQKEILLQAAVASTPEESTFGTGNFDSKSPEKLRANEAIRSPLNGKETNGVGGGSTHTYKGKGKAAHPIEYPDYSASASKVLKKVVPPASFFATAAQHAQSPKVHPPPWSYTAAQHAPSPKVHPPPWSYPSQPPAIPKLADTTLNGSSSYKKNLSTSAHWRGEVATTSASYKPGSFSTNGDHRQSTTKRLIPSEDMVARSAREDVKGKKRARPDPESPFPSPSQPLSKKTRTDVLH
ncbi:hypothetical protein I350_00487 [Cryptococcus amylolentus CBS 6273]|uniref:SET domain-containing protein n=1 Tax=Cryptococcus amylolentus CBS 6273 TaxID=1296118 RepID=A0A1E3KFM9_9TREE|nr:hypothetical protein I350_00487 [Cryptococcus amylolentus CBS 6273]